LTGPYGRSCRTPRAAWCCKPAPVATWRRACWVAASEAGPAPLRPGPGRPRRVSILAWIGLGLVGGAVVGWLWGLRGRALLADGVVGVLGAVLGGFLASVLLGLDIAGLDVTSILVAAVGAAVLILILHALPAMDVFE